MPPKKKSKTEIDGVEGEAAASSKPCSHWLFKSEPESRLENGVDVKFGIEDLKKEPEQTTCWEGVRNFQGRKFMREMSVGQKAFFYHSMCKSPGIAGIVKIVKESYPDPTQFDSKDPHYDGTVKKDKPKWEMVDVKFSRMMKRYISLAEIKHYHIEHKENGGPLANVALFSTQRMSIQPVTEEEWDFILSLEDEEPVGESPKSKSSERKTPENKTEESQYTHWLFKSESESRMEKGVDVKFSIEDLKKESDQTTYWEGVRNFQGRKFMREMSVGQEAFFYHSMCKSPGIAGIVKIVKESYPDPTQFDPKDPHYDGTVKKDKPKWEMVDVKFARMMKRYISLAEIKHYHIEHKESGGPLANIALFSTQRMSIQPVTEEEWDFILSLEDKEPVDKAPETKADSTKAKAESAEAKNGDSSPKYCHWLLKSEPESRMENGVDVKFGIEDLKQEDGQTACWDGVRNYQARKIMRDMREGQDAFFYHSNCKSPGVAGLIKIAKECYPDHTQFDSKDPHYDASSKKDNPKWEMVDVKFSRMMKRYISLAEIKHYHIEHKESGGPLANIALFTRARLSVQPLTKEEFDFIKSLEDKEPAI